MDRKKSKGAQQWCITLNFPKKSQGDCKIPQQSVVKQIIANVNRKPHKTIYLRWTTQMGEQKTLHLQMYLQTTKPMQLDQVKKFYFRECEGISPRLDRQRAPLASQADDYLDGPTCVVPPSSGTSLCGKPEACKYCKLLWTQDNFNKIIWSFKFGERDDTLTPASGQGKRTDLDHLKEVEKKISSGEWGRKEVYANVPHLLGKGVAINYWLQQSSAIEQTMIMTPPWHNDPRTDPTMVQMFKYINTRQNNRSILWIYSNAGGTGKSTMLTYMANKLKAKGIPVFMSSGGKDSDISNIYMEEAYCFFDFPRSECMIPYGFIEQLKNANVTSTKYQGTIKKPKDRHGNLVFPWVVVVANQAPSMERISKDRCKVICLDRPGHAHDLPVVPDQEHRIPEQEPDNWCKQGPVALDDIMEWKWENPANGTGKAGLIDKRGEHGKKEEIKRIKATIPVVEQKKPEKKKKESKGDSSDSDSAYDVVHSDLPPNGYVSPKGKLAEIKSLINKGDGKRSGPPSSGLGLGGGPPPQVFNSMLKKPSAKQEAKVRKLLTTSTGKTSALIGGQWIPQPLTSSTPPPSPSSNPERAITIIDSDDDEPTPVITIKKEGGKPPKRTLINKHKRKQMEGGAQGDDDSEPTQPVPSQQEESGEWTSQEIKEAEEAYQIAEDEEDFLIEMENSRMEQQAKKQKVKEVTEKEEIAQSMLAMIADKKAAAKEKLMKKAGISLQAKLGEDNT